MTATPTTTVPSTEFLPNVAAVVADRGPYDGKRGTVWTPTGQAFVSDANREWDEPGVGRDFTLLFGGTLTRNGEEQGYTDSLRVRFSRWSHLSEQPGTFWSAYPVPGMPEHAGKLVTEQVNKAVAVTLSALFGTDGQLQADVRVFDAVWRELARADLARQAARYREQAADATARALAAEERLAVDDYTPGDYGRR